jgi:hypothetical protein
MSATAMHAGTQETSPGGQSAHPIVGAWQWSNNPGTDEADTSAAIFHADGTYVEFDAAIGVGIGAWAATGESTGDLTMIFQDIELDPGRYTRGLITFHISVEVDETGSALTAQGEVEVLDAAGAVIFNLPYAGQGARIVPQGPGTSGTPVATPQ